MPRRFSRTRMTEPLFEAEQTATLIPAAYASSIRRMTPGLVGTSPLPAVIVYECHNLFTTSFDVI